MKALRYNEGKKRWSLIDYKALEGLVDVLEMGAKKYSVFKDSEGNVVLGSQVLSDPTIDRSSLELVSTGEGNWKLGLDPKSILDSAQRHLVKMMSDENYDEESGLLHAHHVICNMMFWVHYFNKTNTQENKL